MIATTVSKEWVLGDFYCNVTGIINTLSYTASITTLVATLDIRYFLIKNDTVYTYITKNGYVSKTHPNVVNETTNSHVNIGDKEIELLIIASIETLKRQNKKCGKDEVFALVKDSLEEAITMESFEKS